MGAYLPSGPPFVLMLATVLAIQLFAGFALPRLSSAEAGRPLAWALLLAGTAGVHLLARHEPPGVRMLALIASGLLSMKAIVVTEEGGRGMSPLPFSRWLSFAVGWAGMQPRLFAKPAAAALPGAGRLMARGAVRLAFGVALVAAGRLAWTSLHSRLVASIFLLAGLSFILHFGLLNVLAGFWRLRGVAADALFRAPLRSQSLAEFWARRWNLAFSEMTSIAVYRPIARRFGPAPALIAGFLVSGLLHEMAISLPVQAGFGLPMLYFALHGGLVLFERARARSGAPLQGWTGRAWTVLWLVAPLPILFHRPFLAGVVWPLVGIPPEG